MIRDGEILEEYRNTLNFMLQGDLDLNGFIMDFMENMPFKAKRKVFSRGKFLDSNNGYVSELNGKNLARYVYRSGDRKVWISQREKRDDVNYSERIAIDINGITSWEVSNWPRDSRKKIASVSLFMYRTRDDFNRIELNFIVEKIGDKLIMTIENDKINTGIDYEEYLRAYNYYDIVKNCAGKRYTIDISKVVPVTKKR